QREAVEAALELGYYDDPRAATQADVADRLDCAASTAGDHLRKAEAKLVRAGMDVRAGIHE
ncbi:MAG: helix-turn-helix domain-containing protein, partial [Halobacterium sp.]